MKRINIISLGITASDLAYAAEAAPDRTIRETSGKLDLPTLKPHWATPRNSEEWQGRGKRPKPKQK